MPPNPTTLSEIIIPLLLLLGPQTLSPPALSAQCSPHCLYRERGSASPESPTPVLTDVTAALHCTLTIQGTALGTPSWHSPHLPCSRSNCKNPVPFLHIPLQLPTPPFFSSPYIQSPGRAILPFPGSSHPAWGPPPLSPAGLDK